jgi:hypothetical protein
MPWNYLDTVQLQGLLRHTEEKSNFWLSRYFPAAMTFDSEYIEFEKVSNGRKMAPFVSPMNKGKVLADRGSSVLRLKPGYIKPKHALDPNKTMVRRPGEMIGGSMSPGGRADAIMMSYLQDQRDIIERRWEWMAAKAIMDGAVTIGGDENYPESLVEFGRDAGHTVVKTLGARWGDSGVSIRNDLTSWVNTIRKAKFSGPVTDLIVSPTVYDVMMTSSNSDLKDLLDTNYRGSNDSLNRSVLNGDTAQVVGTLGGFLNVIVYQDWFEDDTGNAQSFLADNEIILTGPNVQGVRCFGAIMDNKAGFAPTPIFTKMFEEEDPSAVFLMSQSAPLMVPVNPNNTFKAQVLA